MTMKAPNITSRGFTLLETLVAVSILALAISGPIYVADRALVATQTAKEQLTASYLAQEGIEYMRSMRDHEFLAAYALGSATASEDAWTNFKSGDGSHTGSIAQCITAPCALNPSAAMGFGSLSALRRCNVSGSSSSCPLYTTTNGQYTLTTTSPNIRSPYTRRISATLLPTNPNDILITSTVTWSNRGNPYTVTVTSHLTPWQ